jgi:hypothetical protein
VLLHYMRDPHFLHDSGMWAEAATPLGPQTGDAVMEDDDGEVQAPRPRAGE